VGIQVGQKRRHLREVHPGQFHPRLGGRSAGAAFSRPGAAGLAGLWPRGLSMPRRKRFATRSRVTPGLNPL